MQPTVMALVAALLAGVANAHMTMNSPVPFGKATLNNSPLIDAAIGAGSDFPCKQRTGVYDITQMNTMAVGQPQPLTFEGSASHGGGTCELVISMDLEPTVDSVWKIIQVFEGGCPINSEGNTGSKAFEFTIPQGFPNGRSTFAWVWYNRIGNREIYMNCAPIEVTGGSDDRSVYDSLPNLYLINLPTSDCASADNMNVQIPNPGQYVVRDDVARIAPPSGGGCAAAAAANAAGGAPSAYTPSDNASGRATVNTDNAGAAQPVVAEKAYAYADDTSSAPTTTLVTAAVVSPAAYTEPTPAVADNPAPVANTSAQTPCSGSAMSCTSDGQQFGLCDHGFIVWQPVAPGTTCTNGAIAALSKRHLRSHARDLHRRIASHGHRHSH